MPHYSIDEQLIDTVEDLFDGERDTLDWLRDDIARSPWNINAYFGD